MGTAIIIFPQWRYSSPPAARRTTGVELWKADEGQSSNPMKAATSSWRQKEMNMGLIVLIIIIILARGGLSYLAS